MTKRRPNIVCLVNDHEAYYGHNADSGAYPQRPYLEKLGREGARFHRAYSACPLCTPARRSMMTGLLPHNHGYLTLDPKENGPEHDEGILFDILGQAGYDLNYIGKWHAGPGTSKDYGCRGFCYPEYGNPYIRPEYKDYCRQRGLPEATFDLEHVFLESISPDKPSPGPGYKCEAPHCHSHISGTMETPLDTHEAFFFANLAVDRLRELAQDRNDQPFFMRVDFYGPHPPYLASQEYLDLYDPKAIVEYGSFRSDLAGKPAIYHKEWNSPLGKDERLIQPSALPWSEWQRLLRYVYAQTTLVDAAGGRILDEVDRLGLTDDTLVVWTTDHGDPVAALGGHYGKESFLCEEVLRVPFAMRWPGVIDAGQDCHHPISNMDVPVTLVAAAQGAFKDRVDGRDLGQLFTDGHFCAPEEWRDDIVCETHGHHWEKIHGRALITDRFLYATYDLKEVPRYMRKDDDLSIMDELYDLESDPYQLRNLALERDSAETLADVRRRLQTWQTHTEDPYTFPWQS